jgi:hypothetical protein
MGGSASGLAVMRAEFSSVSVRRVRDARVLSDIAKFRRLSKNIFFNN